MAIKSRIRWTEEEANAVVAAARTLVAKELKLSSQQRLARAQEVLPKARRRPFSANLSSWLNKSVRGDLMAAKEGKAHKLSPGRGFSDASSATAAQALIAIGAEVLRGILADKGVQRALRAALRP